MEAALYCTPLRSSLFSTSSASLFPRPLIQKKIKRLPYVSQILDNADSSALAKTPSKSVTRRLILLRHAESSWNDHSLRDHDRPLSKAGRADAADVSYRLQLLGWVPELILCSDATRTRETLLVMQERVRGFLQAAVHFIPSFYSIAAMDRQTAEHLQKMICKFSSDDIFTVMCMGHNKGWEEAASTFTGSVIELDTCNAALLEATGKSWEEAFESSGLGGWKLKGLVKPNSNPENYVPT